MHVRELHVETQRFVTSFHKIPLLESTSSCNFGLFKAGGDKKPDRAGLSSRVQQALWNIFTKDFQMSPKNPGVQITPDSDRNYVSSIPSTTVKQHPHKHFSAHKRFMSWKVPSGLVFFFLSQLLIHDLPAPAAVLTTRKHWSCEDTTGHKVANPHSERQNPVSHLVPWEAMHVVTPRTAGVFGFLILMIPREKLLVPLQWRKVPGPFHSETCA